MRNPSFAHSVRNHLSSTRSLGSCLRDLADDFHSFDEDTMRVTGSTTGNEYRLGDEVRIRVKEVSVEKRQIDLVMLS